MLDVDRLNAASKRLGDAVISPSTWPQLMEEICQAVGATGAAMLQSDIRTSDIPMTPSMAEYFQNHYFASNLHVNDIRAVRGVPLLLAGAPVVADDDIFSSEREMLRDPLYASLGEYGLRWFAVVGFQSDSALWGLSIQRTTQEGAFTRPELNVMGKLSRRLSETATLSKAVGRLVLSGVSNALNLVRQPAITIDRLGMVIDINSEAEALFDAEIRIRNSRLLIRDKRARSSFDRAIDQIRNTPDIAALPLAPIVVQREARQPVVIRFLPVDGAARGPFLGARALLTLTDLSNRSKPDAALIAESFALTASQAQLAALIATGKSLEEVAADLDISRETARTHLKNVFAKTGTNRQGDLISLLSKL